MPDTRTHRGAAPEDTLLFGDAMLPALRAAVMDLSWLLGRGYSMTSALSLVGNRYSLHARQRIAVQRCAASDEQRDSRLARRVPIDTIRGQAVVVDGFNVLIVTESALSGGMVLRARDGAHRDLASVHGTWRAVSETPRAIETLGKVLMDREPSEVRWVLDRPVGNSGRLSAMLIEHASARGWPWTVDLLNSPDRALAASDAIVASADAWILDRAKHSIDLPSGVIANHPDTWLVSLG
jgi:hypothetical protein